MSGAEGARQILANGAALLLAYVLPRIFTTLSVVIAARILGTRDFGIYGTAAAFAVVLSILATLGMVPLLVRELARDPARAPSLIRAAHLVKTFSNVVMLCALFLLARWGMSYDPLVVRAAMALGLGYALAAYAENFAAYFQAVERMHRWTEACTIFGLVSSIVGVGLLLGTGSLVAFCYGSAAGWAAALAWLIARAPREIRTGSPLSRSDVGTLVHGLAPFALGFVFLSVYCKVDVLVLAKLRGPDDVGIYTAAYKFVDVFQALVVVATSAVYPRLSRAAHGQVDGVWAGTRSTELVLMAAVPTGVALSLAASAAVTIMFGPAYAAATPVVTVLGFVFPLLALSVHGGYVLSALGRMLTVAGLYSAALALNLGLNLILIPARGVEGAALARLASEALLAACVLIALRGAVRPRAPVLALASVAALLGVAVLAIPDPTRGVVRAVAYLVAVLLLYARAGVFRSPDAAALRSVILGRRQAVVEGGVG